MPYKSGVGDGTGLGDCPEEQGLDAFEDAKPETPAAPFDSNRGGRGPELPSKTSSGATSPKD
jgi:hypothetical protein